jgi:hypothetical protein
MVKRVKTPADLKKYFSQDEPRGNLRTLREVIEGRGDCRRDSRDGFPAKKEISSDEVPKHTS